MPSASSIPPVPARPPSPVCPAESGRLPRSVSPPGVRVPLPTPPRSMSHSGLHVPPSWYLSHCGLSASSRRPGEERSGQRCPRFPVPAGEAQERPRCGSAPRCPQPGHGVPGAGVALARGRAGGGPRALGRCPGHLRRHRGASGQDLLQHGLRAAAGRAAQGGPDGERAGEHRGNGRIPGMSGLAPPGPSRRE